MPRDPETKEHGNPIVTAMLKDTTTFQDPDTVRYTLGNRDPPVPCELHTEYTVSSTEGFI